MENLLSHGALPLQTLGMITRQFRLIWQAKALSKKKVSPTEISSKIGAHPYFVGKDHIAGRKIYQGKPYLRVREAIAGRCRIKILS